MIDTQSTPRLTSNRHFNLVDILYSPRFILTPKPIPRLRDNKDTLINTLERFFFLFSTKRTVSYHDNVAADNNDAGAAVAELATLSAPEGTVTSIGESPRNERARLTSADTTESGM